LGAGFDTPNPVIAAYVFGPTARLGPRLCDALNRMIVAIVVELRYPNLEVELRTEIPGMR